MSKQVNLNSFFGGAAPMDPSSTKSKSSPNTKKTGSDHTQTVTKNKSNKRKKAIVDDSDSDIDDVQPIINKSPVKSTPIQLNTTTNNNKPVGKPMDASTFFGGATASTKSTTQAMKPELSSTVIHDSDAELAARLQAKEDKLNNTTNNKYADLSSDVMVISDDDIQPIDKHLVSNNKRKLPGSINTATSANKSPARSNNKSVKHEILSSSDNDDVQLPVKKAKSSTSKPVTSTAMITGSNTKDTNTATVAAPKKFQFGAKAYTAPPLAVCRIDYCNVYCCIPV